MLPGCEVSNRLTMDASRVAPSPLMGAVVKEKKTADFLAAAMARGRVVQAGSAMRFEQVPAYLEYLGL